MTSVLDAMTADTTSRKRAEGTTLTPVGLEKGARIPDVPEVFLTNEAVLDIAKDLRRQAAVLIDVAEGLERHAGREQAPAPADLALEVKLAEREADRQAADRAKAAAGDKKAEARVASTDVAGFQEHFEELKAAAQAATFGPETDLVSEAKRIFADDLVDADAPAEPEPAASGSVVPGWECPTHGSESLADHESKSGRKFRSCTICKQFQK